MEIATVGTPATWAAFIAIVLVLLALDLGVFHRKAHAVRVSEAALWCVFWISCALAFNVWIYFAYGGEKALEFLGGYLTEEALSVDNLFVFLVLFSYFKVPPDLQHRVLFWGIVGAMVFRVIFIWLGVVVLERFHWVNFVLGAFLVLTGLKLLFQTSESVEPQKNPVVRVFRRFVPMVSDYRGTKFWVRENGKLLATPLLLVLASIEVSDVMFAVDSIPAVFGITHDPFIVFTSNIFAILGLRSLFFVLAGMMASFRFLHYGLGLILGFVGAKLLIADYFHIPVAWSLGVIAGLLFLSVAASLAIKPPPQDDEPPVG